MNDNRAASRGDKALEWEINTDVDPWWNYRNRVKKIIVHAILLKNKYMPNHFLYISKGNAAIKWNYIVFPPLTRLSGFNVQNA